MLESFVLYNDLCLEIEILQEQISLTEKEVNYWYGRGSIPLLSYGSSKFGINTALDQSEKKIRTLSKLKKRLELLKESKQKTDSYFSKFEGLEYKVAKMKYVDGKTLKQIAAELGYSYIYIREVMGRIRKSN